MTPRFTTTGNAKPWRSRGYQDRSAVSGPLERIEPLNFWIIGAGPLIALVGLLFAETVRVLL